MKVSAIKQWLADTESNNQRRQISDLRMLSATRGLDSSSKEYIVFSSNNYLGLSHNPSVIEAAKNAAQFGTGSTGSRLTSGAGYELSQLEYSLAAFKHTEAAIVFNTGYMTNLGVIYALADKDCIIFSDELNHASIIDGCRISRAKVVIYRHCDMAHLESLLQDTPISPTGQRFIITDGVFSMDGDIAPLPELVRLRSQYDACLIVDDAHAVGVIGSTGRGSAEYCGIDNGIDIQIGTLSKALGAEGGYAAASRQICDYLINKSRPFIFSTALPPSVAAAADQALHILTENGSELINTLHERTVLMRNMLTEADLPIINGTTPIIPILCGEESRTLKLAQLCREDGILLSAIRPPSVPVGSSRIRLTVTAAHSAEEIQTAANIIIKNWRRL
ncbi:MAG: 8-amino-7-oxononanoate synthase [Spirochaetales bacterium]|nr:8-amino-7-oxononanoate synthase [Spirochaetales bacterium]